MVAIATSDDTGHAIGSVAGTLAVQQLPGGTFDVQDRVFQYREFPVAGSWRGDFSGIRQTDFAPIDVRAVLLGEGAYEGLCATLDITALKLAYADTWVLDGIIHPVDMS